MRLLTYDSNGELYVTRDLVDDDIPPYAILSHTWGNDEEEVRFNEIGSKACRPKVGYRKIEFCGRQARRDGVQHFWVDTCCIDKTNHTELSEAITSMYRWYQNAQVCYVYLTDVPSGQNNGDTTVRSSSPRRSWKPSFRKSRWFTRGWTLQELLAPQQVVFYSNDCECLGTKQTLKDLLCEITSIPVAALENQPLSQFTVTERLRWTEGRTTKKKEDRAYCLQGIFSVHLPLIYGEGDHAFVRLTEAINRVPKVSVPLQVVHGAAFNAYSQAHQGCHPATRIDLLQSVRDWTRDAKGKSIFWLSGVAGTGKSTISWTVAKRLADLGSSDITALGGSFFFKRGEGERASAALFFPTIASQLASSINNFDVFLAQAITADPQICNKSLGEQFNKLICEPLQRVSSTAVFMTCVTYIVVVDALDECENENDIRTLLQLWSKLPAMDTIRVRLFLTSRPELVIRLGFKRMSNDIHRDLILHEIPESVIQHDILVFLSDALCEVRKDYNLLLGDELSDEKLADDWPGSQTLQKLTHMAMPLFIVAATIYGIIRKADRPQNRLEMILRSGKNARLSEMGKIYLLVLQAMTRSIHDQEEVSQIHGEFRTIVGTITALAEPLSRTALAALLSMKPSDIQIRLQSLHAVLEIPSDGDTAIRPLHLSFGEYLTSQEIQETPYWVNAKTTHASLWRRCLQLLSGSSGLRENICNLRHPGQLLSDVPSMAKEKCLRSEVRYACRYWVHHIQHSGQHIQDKDEVLVFLRKHFLHWLEALSLIDRISEAIDLLAILQSYLSATASDLSAFLRDARRFILAYRFIIGRAPLQVYSSAIIFAPEGSLVRRFCGQVPFWIKNHPRTSGEWGSEIQTLEGHFDNVQAVAFSPRGTLLASGSWDCTIRLWDARTGEEVQKLQGNSDWVTALAFSPDGTLLASGCSDGTVHIWDTHTGGEMQIIERHSSGVNALVFSPDGTLFALELGSNSFTVWSWDVHKGHKVQELKSHADDTRVLALSYNANLIASGSGDCTVRLWDMYTGSQVRNLEGHSGGVNALTFSPSGDLVASGAYGGTVRVWDTRTGSEAQKLQCHYEWISALVFSPDGTLLASGAHDGTVQVWDVHTGGEVQRLEGHAGFVGCLVFSPDSAVLVSGHYDFTVRLWEPRGRETQKLERHSRHISHLKFSPSGTLLASGSWDTTIRLWDTRTGGEVQTIDGHSGNISALAFSPDGTLLASSACDDTVCMWDLRTGSEVQRLECQSGFRALAFSPGGTLLVSTPDGLILPWEPRRDRQICVSQDMAVSQNERFDDTTTCPITDRETLDISDAGIIDTGSISSTGGETVDVMDDWIQLNGQNLLWLPHDYRGISTVYGDQLAIGTQSGMVRIFQLDIAGIQSTVQVEKEVD